MTSITLSTVLRRRPDIRYRHIEDEAVVVRQSSAEVLVLNEVGASVLDLADGERDVRAWIDALSEVYDTDPAVLARDVLAFAAEMEEAGLLEAVEDAP